MAMVSIGHGVVLLLPGVTEADGKVFHIHE